MFSYFLVRAAVPFREPGHDDLLEYSVSSFYREEHDFSLIPRERKSSTSADLKSESSLIFFYVSDLKNNM